MTLLLLLLLQVFLSHQPLSFATTVLLACALCIHSVLEGVALGAQLTMEVRPGCFPPLSPVLFCLFSLLNVGRRGCESEPHTSLLQSMLLNCCCVTAVLA
jgi:hypothetical protein